MMDNVLAWISRNSSKGSVLASFGVAILALVLGANELEPFMFIAALLILAIIFLLIFFYWPWNDSTRCTSSDDWFDNLAEKLSSAKSAFIYLRSFEHPDDFEIKHRDKLMKIMDCFVGLLDEHQDSFRLVGYLPNRRGVKDPLNWLRGELEQRLPSLEASKRIDMCIKRITSQTFSNTATIYLVDDHYLFYNRKENRDTAFYVLEITQTLIPHLIRQGFKIEFKV